MHVCDHRCSLFGFGFLGREEKSRPVTLWWLRNWNGAPVLEGPLGTFIMIEEKRRCFAIHVMTIEIATKLGFFRPQERYIALVLSIVVRHIGHFLTGFAQLSQQLMCLHGWKRTVRSRERHTTQRSRSVVLPSVG